MSVRQHDLRESHPIFDATPGPKSDLVQASPLAVRRTAAFQVRRPDHIAEFQDGGDEPEEAGRRWDSAKEQTGSVGRL